MDYVCWNDILDLVQNLLQFIMIFWRTKYYGCKEFILVLQKN